MDLLKYIAEEVLYIIPALNIIGWGIKSLKIKWLPSQLIPVFLAAFGIGGAVAILGFSLNSVIQGILCAGAAVFLNQAWKQGSELINKE